jgi:hypothetical protein
MKDNNGVATAAAAIKDLLFYLVDYDQQIEVLEKVLEAARAAHKKPRFEILSVQGLEESVAAYPWNDVMEFKARAVYVFTRNITNNHSPERAAELLFSQLYGVPGSGLLLEYLSDLPRKAQLKTAL